MLHRYSARMTVSLFPPFQSIKYLTLSHISLRIYNMARIQHIPLCYVPKKKKKKYKPCLEASNQVRQDAVIELP